jgi:hypothetical protein
LNGRSFKDINVDILTERKVTGSRWKKYIEELCQGTRPLEENLMKDDSETDDENQGPYILRSEAIQQQKTLRKTKLLEKTKSTQKSSKH